MSVTWSEIEAARIGCSITSHVTQQHETPTTNRGWIRLREQLGFSKITLRWGHTPTRRVAPRQKASSTLTMPCARRSIKAGDVS